MKLSSPPQFLTRISVLVIFTTVGVAVPVVVNTLIGFEYVYPNLVNAQEQVQQQPQDGVKENATSAAAYTPNGISQRLDYAHFIPVGPLSGSLGNQVKLLLNYTVEEPSLANQQVNAVMEVYNEANKSLIKTSSYPDSIMLDKTEGTIQLATTLNDKDLRNVTAIVVFTDNDKVMPISTPLETRLSLGQMMR